MFSDFSDFFCEWSDLEEILPRFAPKSSQVSNNRNVVPVYLALRFTNLSWVCCNSYRVYSVMTYVTFSAFFKFCDQFFMFWHRSHHM